MNLLFKGVATALYTPFTKTGIDYEQFEAQIERQLQAKVDALVFLGTTGECATITHSERKDIIRFAVNKLKGKLPIIVGTGSNCTDSACSFTNEAKELGADGALIVTPYYNKCEQDGLYLHYREISKRCKFPFIAYSVPTRTGVEILPDTLKKIALLDGFSGIKEANCDRRKIEQTISVFGKKPPVYCGSDEMIKHFLELNCAGIISVSSNVIPLKIKEYIRDFTNDYDDNLKIDESNLFTILKALTTKVNPIPIKVLASLKFNEKCVFRLPLNYPDETYVNYLKSILKLLK